MRYRCTVTFYPAFAGLPAALIFLAVSCVAAISTAMVDAAPAAQSLTASAGNSSLTFADPKTGAVLWTANVRQIDAMSGSGANQITGTMLGVNGVFYQLGKRADSFSAPKVIADNGQKMVTAVGGVKIVSLTQIATSLHCDRAVWYAAQNKLIGWGHVVFRKGGFTQTGSSFAADTRLKRLVMPAPGVSDTHGINVLL